MKQLLFLLPIVVLISCGTEKQTNEVDTVTPVAEVYTGITGLQPHRPNIDLTPWDGDLYESAYWRDSRGENIIIISGNQQYFWAGIKPELEKRLEPGQDAGTYEEATDIYARHYVLRSGEAKWQLKYEYYDVMLGCCDVFMEFQPGSLEIQDADSNGVGDMLFTYQTADGDGKLEGTWYGREVLLADSADYAIRGMSVTSALNISDQLTNSCPEASPYRKVMEEKWGRDCALWKDLLLARTTAGNEPELETHSH